MFSSVRVVTACKDKFQSTFIRLPGMITSYTTTPGG
uniref:Uncharacterized protein n=1 Tax=Anguilla anguilla TaxID=7936 RepID=A0A0E9TLZ3_ANGAN